MLIVDECLSAVGEICDDLVTTAKGLMITTKYLRDPDEIVTIQYGRPVYEGEPSHKLTLPKSYRGELVNDVERCVVCDLCAKACPTQCISMDSEKGADNSKLLHFFHIDMTICLYCGLCTEACPDKTKDESGEKCLTMSGNYDYSSDRKESIGFYFNVTDEKLKRWQDEAKKRADEKAAKKAAPKPATVAGPSEAPAQ